nr:rapid alkalinization factor-like [Ipomoea batatas]
MAKKVKSTGFLAICAIFIITAVLSSPAAVTASAGAYEIGYFPMAMPSASSKICDGSVGECLSDDEFELDTESNRRILAYRQRYISYGALSRNRVPCSRRGFVGKLIQSNQYVQVTPEFQTEYESAPDLGSSLVFIAAEGDGDPS